MKYLIIASLAESLVGFRKPLILALLGSGITVHVVAPGLRSNKKVIAELESIGVISHEVHMVRTGVKPTSDLKTLWDLFHLIRKLQPDYVMGYTIKPVVYGGIAAWLAKVPKRFSLITGLGYAFINEKSLKRKIVSLIARVLYKKSLNHTHVIFFQNFDDERLFFESGILSCYARTIVVNGSGVNLVEYPMTSLPDINFPRFLFIGRLLGDKGVREYAEAALLVKKKYPEVEFDLVGRIDINPNAIKQEELDVWVTDGRLNYFGQLDDVRPRIAACSVYVLPSYREGTPRTVLEAMSMGRAIITTDAPGCRETVEDGVNGFLVPVKNAQVLAEAMIRFIEQPDLIEIMAIESRKIAERKYDVRIVNKQMLDGMGI